MISFRAATGCDRQTSLCASHPVQNVSDPEDAFSDSARRVFAMDLGARGTGPTSVATDTPLPHAEGDAGNRLVAVPVDDLHVRGVLHARLEERRGNLIAVRQGWQVDLGGASAVDRVG